MFTTQFDLYKSGLDEATLRLLLETLEAPGAVDINKIRDEGLRLVKRREKAAIVG
ncbi:hypothetical protein Pyrfu_0631 [Pyrolobus fumarii 1A]|uniref:Uncharacterized protein n=1 Tax=Pyrolobus fumarii (strain DSM 11204 / 1A) TaxID=694429 RepID=G0EHC5_PYRF1|nr:hypothetical protein [Pyrolobus fumarii]AEM38500.1 hypothetical protein Pyrfu_0631 [Pyrolobus fumarii 1A]